MSALLVNQFQGNVDGNLARVPGFDDEVGEGVDEEATVVTAQQCVGEDFFMLPGGALVELFAHPAATALTLRVNLVEELELLLLRRELVDVPLDNLQVKYGVQLFENCHWVRG